MSPDQVEALLESHGAWEKLEDLSSRFALPHIPEFELVYFRGLYHLELEEALDAVDARLARGPAGVRELELRGRLRRLFGDRAGAAADFNAALDLDPRDWRALAGLAEIDLARPEARIGLARALEHGAPARVRLKLGVALMLAGDDAGAKAELEAFRRAEPSSALGHLLAGVRAERAGDPGAARAAYRLAHERRPACPAVCLLLSRLGRTRAETVRWFRKSYNVGPVLGFVTLQLHQTMDVESPGYIRRITKFCFDNPEKVGAYYRRETTQTHFSHFPAEDYDFVARLVKRNPHLSWAHAFYGRAACYAKAGAAEGVAHLTRAIELAPEAGWLFAWRANARRLGGDRAGALKDFDEAIRRQPFYHRAFVWRGTLMRRLGRLKEALRDLDRAMLMDPYYSLTYYERSMTRRALGDLAGAALDLDRAFMLDRRYNWVFKTGGPPSPEDYARGDAELTRGIQAHPRVPSLWAWRGELRLRKGDWPGAFADLEQATRLDPLGALGFAWYGLGFLQAGQPERAVPHLRRAAVLEPRLHAARGWLAEALHSLGRTREAAAVLRGVLREKPQTPWAFYLLAKFDLAARRPASACARLKRALLLDGKYPEAYLLLSEAELARGRVAAASRAAQACVDIAPNLGRVYVARAAAHQAAGRWTDAVADYRRALKDFPYLFNPEQAAEISALLSDAGPS